MKRGRVARVVAVAALALAAAPVAAQSLRGPGGVWAIDPARTDGRDVYGELRVVRQTDEAVHVTMIDYGVAWIAGSFREVVRMVPWTFPFGWWAPRRGPEDSGQPLARGRRLEDGLVLAKATAYGNGDFVWVWRVADNGLELEHRETTRHWDSDFAANPPTGRAIRFLRLPGEVGSSALLADTAADGTLRIPAATRIVVTVAPDLALVHVTCPLHDCRIVFLETGHETGTRVLARGASAAIPALAEVRIEPVPADRQRGRR